MKNQIAEILKASGNEEAFPIVEIGGEYMLIDTTAKPLTVAFSDPNLDFVKDAKTARDRQHRQLGQISTLCRSLDVLRRFMNKGQFACLADLTKNSEERDFFKSVVNKLASQLVNMPKLYETDGDQSALFTVHLFGASGRDFYIKEMDLQTGECFGFIKAIGNPAELGYFNLNEISAHVEFDFHFEPVTLGTLRA